MKVFISWSGQTSLKVAQALRDWLPGVINSIEPYVSSEDIDKGARWSTDIANELENSTFGILCVTKDNFEAPWLSFEAGALSKTIDKSFVMPFLFDIKLSDVKGPILQFQSTIFEKDDIKKMVKTLNKACGDSGIHETRIDRTFDVWYPELEKELDKIKASTVNNDQSKDVDEDSAHSSEILEEILVLSRDNQKLLKNPEVKLRDDMEELKKSLADISEQNTILFERKRKERKYDLMFFEEIIHRFRGKSAYDFLMCLSFLREDFPWIYYMGKELIEILKGEDSHDEKMMAISNFRELIDYTYSHPAMRELFGFNVDGIRYSRYLKELSYILMRYLDDMNMSA